MAPKTNFATPYLSNMNRHDITSFSTLSAFLFTKRKSTDLLLHLLIFLNFNTAKSNYSNLYGDQLEYCSTDGMALTGFTRTGQCVTQNDDKGSHHICIDISSASGGNFCDITGQSDWCSKEMPCSEDSNEDCEIQHWCVCQWAFASYIEKAGGCDMIQDIVCEAINMEAFKAYKTELSKRYESKIQNAVDCLENRCGYSYAMQSVALLIDTSASEASRSFRRFFQNGLFIISGTLLTAGISMVIHRLYLVPKDEKKLPLSKNAQIVLT